MVPAPDEFPDFDSMTPEEQMAWLESLARRQGANADEFVTAADQDIPIPENVEIDEPGYVPYSIREGLRVEREPEPPAEPGDTEPFGPEDEEQLEEAHAAPRADLPDPHESIAADAEETPDEEFPPVVEDVEFQADAFVTAAEMINPDDPSETGIADLEEAASDETLDDEALADPMTWLDSLTPQATAGEADFLAELERAAAAEDFTLDWDEDEGQPGVEQGVPLYDAAGAVDFDQLEELGLEGFQERDFGEEARAAADLNTPSVDTGMDDAADSWLEAHAERGTPEQAEEAEAPRAVDEAALREAAAAADEADLGEPESEPEPETVAEAEWSEDDVLGGADPIAWLETLARRQGADLEELTTEADLDIPELPEDTVVDEPGYTEYSPFGILPPRREESLPLSEEPRAEQDESAAELESLSESLGWLADMTKEPEAELTTWLAVEDTFADRELSAEDEAIPAPEQPAEPADALAGMTDEEIELALRRGELTAEQELAWLQRTARERAAQLSEVAGELGEESGADLDVEPAEPGEIPPWLAAMREEAVGDDADTEDLASLFDTEIAEAEAAAEIEPLLADDASITEAELAAFLEDEDAIGETDALTESLVADLISDAAAEPVEPGLAEAEPIDMPDWLVEQDEEFAAADAELPGWLAEPLEEPAVPVEEVPDWLSELGEPEAAQAPAAEEFAPGAAAESLPEPEFFAPQREAVIPEGELFVTYRQRLEEDPSDHATRLALARTLRGHGEVAPSLDHYETLIENAQLLEDVANDLSTLVQEQPFQPRARRLLGDTLMRQGRLQDALEAYRKALEQL